MENLKGLNVLKEGLDDQGRNTEQKANEKAKQLLIPGKTKTQSGKEKKLWYSM